MKNLNLYLVLAMCGGLFSGQAYADATADIVVSDPYARAVPEGQKNSAAFMDLQNTGKDPHAVVEARSPVSNIVELHTHVNENGMMKMRQVEKIDVPAGATTTLKPGGLHVMFIDLKQQIKPGDMVPVTLIFEDGSQVELTVPGKKLKMKMKMKKHEMGS